MSNVFDYIKAINQKTDIEFDSEFEEVYSQFVVGRQFSYFPETVLVAQEANLMQLTNKQHFQYLNNTIEKGNRFCKWDKAIKHESLDIIKRYYGYSTKLALEVIDLFTEDDINNIKNKLDEGGVNGK